VALRGNLIVYICGYKLMAQRARNNGHLLEPAELAEAGPPEAVRLPLDLVDPNPANPRAQLVELDALAENIRTFGLLQPITVRRHGERYELIGGHRRLAAFALLREREPHEPQWRSVPAVVRTFDDETGYLALISSQVHNRAWRPREEAAALERLVLAGRNLKQIGEALNRTESWASKRLRVYSDSVLSAYVQTGQIPAAVAEEFLVVRDVDARRRLADHAAAEQWTKDKAKAEVRLLRIDLQLAELGRRAREMAELLSVVEPHRIPIEVQRDLMVVRGRIDVLSGRTARVPTLEEAERVAGVTPRQKARAEKERQAKLRARRKSRA
jgi:ParB family transcriptional regulator, chromosome partitioning protein